MRILLLTLILAGLSACSSVRFPGVYRIDVEQGNIVTQELVDQLKPGMSRRQVRFILGTPLLEDTFNQNRWDYPYVKRNGVDVLSQSHLTVVFEEDSLVEIRGDYLPEWSQPEIPELGLPPVPGSEDEQQNATPRAV
jgi:outer membrane protein assembly factor BamE